MLYNHLGRYTKRHIAVCNYNQHIRTVHPDRILNHHDLVYIREGEWRIAQDGIDYTVSAGDVILLQSGHHHYGTAPCRDVVKTIFIEFAVCEGDSVSEATDGENDYSFPMVIHCADTPSVHKYLENAVAAFWADEPHERMKAAIWLDLLLCELSCIGHRSDTLVEKIKSTVQKTPGRFLSNTELAEQLHCSVRTLSSRFKAATGESIHAWQIKLKCQMAEELMRREPHTTLKELAANYGFYDEYQFGKCYKKVMGHSPKRTKK